MTSRIAIIAGSGRFPFHVAQEAKRQGAVLVAIGIQGWADATLASHVEAYEELPVGQIGRIIKQLKSWDVRQAVMAGKVTKHVLVNGRTAFDLRALSLLGRVKEFSVPVLLGAIGQMLADEGITLLDSSTFLKESLCPLGVLTARAPTAAEQTDMQLGLRVARALAALDVGQTVLVKNAVVVAVEALEGTDAAIQRAQTLAGGGLVMVKTASPNQDRRFDLPIIGMETIAHLAASGGACLSVEAGTTLLLDRDALIASANAAKLCLVGVSPESLSASS